MTNPATLIDGYKTGHIHQYPDKTQVVYSNWTPRDSRTGQTGVVVFGLQAFLQKYLMDEWELGFFQRPKEEVVNAYAKRMDGYLGPNNVGTEHIAALWDLGYLPLRFKALPEGSVVPIRCPMLTVENTDERFAWLVNYFETLMSCELWLPSTSATTALAYRRIFEMYAHATGSPIEFVDWQGHDFSFRGMAGLEAAQLSGAGHLLSFTGTDTIPAIDFLEFYYGASDTFVGGSVAATEHSVMCAGGADEGDEQATFERLMDIYPTGILSVVSDTWDLWKVLTEILPNLKDQIEAREGKLVIRPDSGDPVKIICGDPDALVGTPAAKGVIELLWETFGGTETEKGYRVLSERVGAIYGDSITLERADQILAGLMAKGFASCNVVLGVGSFTYQYVTRDTYGFAMKATLVKIDGEWKEIFKNPVTDNGMKKSAKGRIAILNDAPKGLTPSYRMIDQQPMDVPGDCLQDVWVDGRFKVWYDLETIRKTLRQFL